MKKVIDGKIYNTDTATLIANWDNGMARNDFGWCDESLHITKKGTYFVYGAGGALSRWSVPCGNNGQMGGQSIEVLSKAEALEWCETHDVDADTIAQNFEVEEG